MKNICAQVVAKLIMMNGIGSQYNKQTAVVMNDFPSALVLHNIKVPLYTFLESLTPKQCPISVPDPNLEIRGSPGHPDPEKRGEGDRGDRPLPWILHFI